MNFTDMLNQYIRAELIIVIPALYFLERILVKSKIFSKNIWNVLLIVSLSITALYTFSINDITSLKSFYACMFSIITQGILLTGGSMFIDEIIQKKIEKEKTESQTGETDKTNTQ